MKVSFLSKLSDILIFLGSVIIIILSFLIIGNNDQPKTSYLSSLQDNWNTSPIYDLQEAVNNICPIGYSLLIDDEFYGTQNGCLCGTTINLGYCSSNTCTSINPIANSKINYWRGKKLCAKHGNLNYYTHTKADKESICSSGLIDCGNLDSLGNKLCVNPLISDCPLNDIQIVNSNQIVAIEYKTILLGNNKKLIFSKNKPNGAILVEAKLFENTPCVDPDYKNLKRSVYILDNYFYNASCPSDYNDGRFVLKDKNSIISVLLENNAIDKFSNLPLYPSFDNNEIGLFSRNYIGVFTKCGSNLDNIQVNKSITYITSKYDSLNTYGKIVALFNIALIFFLFYSYFTMKYFYIFTSNNKEATHTFLKGLASFWYFVICCLNLAFLITLSNMEIAYNTILPGLGCGDKYNDSMIVLDMKLITYMKSNVTPIFFLSFIFAILVWVDNLLCYHSILEHEKDQ